MKGVDKYYVYGVLAIGLTVIECEYIVSVGTSEINRIKSKNHKSSGYNLITFKLAVHLKKMLYYS